MRRWLLPLLLLTLLTAGACALLPDRLAVRGPIASVLLGTGRGTPSDAELAGLQVPDGYGVSVFAEGLRARTLRFTKGGDLLVSTPRDGSILLLSADRDGDWRADASRVLLSELESPYGVDFHEGWLYVAEGGAIGRIRFDAVRGTTQGTYERIVEGIPAGRNHWTRTLRVGPDERLYVTVGSSCNVCEEDDPRRAAMLRYALDGSAEELYATGLRNAVGFDWHPTSGALYATDNGRDTLGPDFPPCELNRVVQGGFYGWPYANGDRVPDPDFGAGHTERILGSIPPTHDFRAHNAPLGITFVSGNAAPAAYRGSALVALHGSWNRPELDGYKVVSLHWQSDGSIEERDFATGFLQGDEVIGRPVDVAVGPYGAFYVSDDYAQAIYRIAPGRAPEGAARAPRPAAGDPLAGLPAHEVAAASERGRTLYEQYRCYSCHETERADAGIVATALGPGLPRYDLEGLAGFFLAPTPPMPVLPLSPSERRDLAVYLFARTR